MKLLITERHEILEKILTNFIGRYFRTWRNSYYTFNKRAIYNNIYVTAGRNW